MAQGKGKVGKNTFSNKKSSSKQRKVKISGGSRTGVPKKRRAVKSLGQLVRRNVTAEINKNIEEIMKARVLHEGKKFKLLKQSDEAAANINMHSAPKTGAVKRKKAFGDLSRLTRKIKHNEQQQQQKSSSASTS